MTITLRTKLAAYEDSLIGNDPFEDGTYTKESQDIKEQLPIKDDSGTNESKNQVIGNSGTRSVFFIDCGRKERRDRICCS